MSKCRVISCVVGKGCLLWSMCSLHRTLLAFHFSSVQLFSHVQFLQPHGLQHTSFLCPSPTPGACSNSCPSIKWCHPVISSHIDCFFRNHTFPMHTSSHFIVVPSREFTESLRLHGFIQSLAAFSQQLQQCQNTYGPPSGTCCFFLMMFLTSPLPAPFAWWTE